MMSLPCRSLVANQILSKNSPDSLNCGHDWGFLAFWWFFLTFGFMCGWPLSCRVFLCTWIWLWKFWSSLDQGFFPVTESVCHFWSSFLPWCCPPPFLEVVHSWAHCAWVSTWQCVYAMAWLSPMYAWKEMHVVLVMLCMMPWVLKLIRELIRLSGICWRGFHLYLIILCKGSGILCP